MTEYAAVVNELSMNASTLPPAGTMNVNNSNIVKTVTTTTETVTRTDPVTVQPKATDGLMSPKSETGILLGLFSSTVK